MNERIMILEMVKNNKISVDDAVKLLNAINKNKNSSFDDFNEQLKYKFNNITKPNTNKIKENTQYIFNKSEEIFGDIKKSFREFFNSDINVKDNIENTDENNNNVLNLNKAETHNKNDVEDENTEENNK